MSAIPKSNIKRIRDILLADENRINNDVNDNQGSDFEHGDVVTVSQPETLKKNGVTWSMYPNFSSNLYSLCISIFFIERSTPICEWRN
ncbi:unnamed protein product [Rotaria socialis]|uniref:Uncharacterized protein n=1 Tax=Rotaria socialis TaxID=392032 RepID=A0A821Q143_9BILA|nr:unnamed protein product [Rotaria socialis]CAF4815117.1 unnamed protein product [Rotaria socialis]